MTTIPTRIIQYNNHNIPLVFYIDLVLCQKLAISETPTSNENFLQYYNEPVIQKSKINPNLAGFLIF